jgi:hypothetical protein
MGGNFSDKVMIITKAVLLGFLGATAIIHVTLLFLPTLRDFENRYLAERHPEFEIAIVLTVGFLTLIMEPVTYIVNLAVSLEKYGAISFLWLLPVGITQSYACVRYLIRKKL